MDCVPAPKASGALFFCTAGPVDPSIFLGSSRFRRRQRAAGSSGALPAFPPFGTAAPRSVLLAWHTQARAWLERNTARDVLSDAVAARDGADREVQIANLRVKATSKRHLVARRDYLELTCRHVEGSKGKGKGVRSPSGDCEEELNV